MTVRIDEDFYLRKDRSTMRIREDVIDVIS